MSVETRKHFEATRGQCRDCSSTENVRLRYRAFGEEYWYCDNCAEDLGIDYINIMKGTITQVIGPVVDARFDEGLPAIKNALVWKDNDRKITLEVAQHLGVNRVRAIALSDTAGLSRGEGNQRYWCSCVCSCW